MGLFGGKKDEAQSSNYFNPGERGSVTSRLDDKFGDRDKSLTNSDRRENAGSMLKKGEADASERQNKKSGSDVTHASEGERNVASDFTNNVTGEKNEDKGANKFSAKSIFKKLAPIAFAAAGIGTYGAFSFFGQMAMPFSVIAQFQGNFDSIGTSTHIRTSRFLRAQANPVSRTGVGDEAKNFVKQHSKIYQLFTGDTDDYFKISTRQKKKFSRNGIEVVTDDASGVQVMKYLQKDGTTVTIVPDQSMADGTSKFYIDDFYDNNADFRNSYFSSAKTWRGAVGAWYDNMATKFLAYFNIDRGVWYGYKKSAESEENTKNFKTTVEDNADGDLKGKASTNLVEEDVDDETGDVRINDGDVSEDSLEIDAGASNEEINQKTTAFVNSKVTKLLNAAGAVANVACMAADVVGAINLIVVAYQTTQIVKVASSLFEGIQKSQVEDSSTAPINEIGNALTTPASMEYTLPDKENTVDQSANSTGSIATKKVSSNKSAMESEGMRSLFGNFATNYKDPSVQSFNVTNSISSIMAALGSSMAAYRGCSFAKLGAAAVQGAIQASEIVGCISSIVLAGVGCLAAIIHEVGKEIAKSIAIALVSSIVISAIVPFFANILTRKIATEVMGEDLGNALVSGANIYMGQNHQYSGGSVASKESLTKFLVAKAEYNEDIARHERETLSPFDYTSKNTMMGSLVTKTMPVIIAGSSITNKVSAFGNVVRGAFASLMPGAHAATAAITAQEAANATESNCPNLADVGAVGDAFCNPYIITDLGTTDLDPAQVVYKVSQLDSRNFDTSSTDTDVPVIKQKSRLGNYIKYCGQRQSPFGFADQNIANEFKDANTGSSVGDSIIGAIPVIGSAVDMYNNAKVIANFGYVSGESCVTGNATTINDSGDMRTGETSDWSENKYYQRFIEDQRLAENMGLVEKSAVTAFLEDYYKENPIDNSYEGVLARRSGLTKDQVIATLDIMEAMAFMEGYNPDGLYPLNYSEPEAVKVSFEDVYQENMDRGFISSDMRGGFLEDRRIKNFAV